MTSIAAGIVRPARRPPAWRVPGPAPAAPTDRPDVWPQAGEDLCHLSGDWRILQRVRGHRWSLDDLVTAWFAAEQVASPARIADLGCGIGAVLLMLAWRCPAARCVGVEAQEASAALARRSIAWNGVDDRCVVRGGDLRDPAVLHAGAVFDLVTATPPYLPPGSGRAPTRPLQAPCHIEQRGGIEAYCQAAARLLAPGARFVVCHAATQVARVHGAAAAAGLVIERRMDVIPRSGKAALFSVYAMRRDRVAGTVLAPLVVRDRDGQWTAQFRGLRADMGMPG
jgi:tRNA1(Val) A37 N6-methylase TrmN6